MNKWLQSIILITISVLWGFAVFTLISIKDPYYELLGDSPLFLCLLNMVATLGLSESMKIEVNGIKGILKNTLLSFCTCAFIVIMFGIHEAKYG